MLSRPSPHPSLPQRGLSLVESCVVCLILGILLATALPAMQRLMQGQRLQQIAHTLMTDLQQARSDAVRRSDSVHFRFSRHALGSCYVIHGGSSGDCRCSDAGQAVCSDPALLLKLQWLPASLEASISANVANLSFQPRQGAVTSTGSIDIVASNGQSIRHVVSIAGRVRSCSPNGSVGGLPRCAT
ncbi:hypothetical protein G8A07_13590 [Roseateles sp. DAIF2]|uniref:GspH/FimT family pseudopilin n=1 Tax=Roseateles sp. DAIF2 TaxID=2714952 RepID=UPI0018A31240|nr:GspH/FimT family pseudopilin [Roseateles sp. DAIF2]QPF73849.1 hypothetical protein G8A07_13590 [Roseateles sp. DAIF2]